MAKSMGVAPGEAFSITVKRQALARSKGRCECQRLNHLHFDRCAMQVNIDSQFHQITAQRSSSSSNILSNCEVLCVSCCRVISSVSDV